MYRVPFKGGQYDGVELTFTDRLPEEIELAFDCVGGDMNSDAFREAFEVNLAPDERDLAILIKNADSVRYRYKLDTGGEGEPYYRYASWTVFGVEHNADRAQ
ncbi:MAG TPA: hypothetical protein VGN42_03730 [Pirellulales bacterium]|nr:hypothetical protein [Pirellulales bacterium]